MNEKTEEKKAVNTIGRQELNKIDVLGIEFQTNEKGIELLNGISKVFDMIKVNQENDKEQIEDKKDLIEDKELNNKRKCLGDVIERITADNQENHLTFVDGVLVTWRIFDRILKKRLVDENEDLEQGVCQGHSYDYLAIINDDITSLLLNQVLENGYFKTRGYQLMHQLMHQFCIETG